MTVRLGMEVHKTDSNCPKVLSFLMLNSFNLCDYIFNCRYTR